MPVTMVLTISSRRPMISTSCPFLRVPRSTRPVTTVPRPLIEKTSSMGIRKGWLMSRTGVGMYSSTVSINCQMGAYTGASGLVSGLSRICRAEPRMMGVSAGNS